MGKLFPHGLVLGDPAYMAHGTLASAGKIIGQMEMPPTFEQPHGDIFHQTDEDCFAVSTATSIRDKMLLQGIKSPEMPSPRWIYWYGRWPDVTIDAGTSPERGIGAVQSYGYCEDKYFKYSDHTVFDPPTDEAKQHATDQGDKLKVHVAISDYEMKYGLYVRRSTCHIGSMIDDAFEQLPGGEVWTMKGPVIGAHEFRIIGWDDFRQAWRIMNSWLNWSDGGYGWISYAQAAASQFKRWLTDEVPQFSEEAP